MQDIVITNQTRPLPAALRAGFCSSFFCRFKGLMLRKGIPMDWGLLLVQPSESIVNAAIHMFAVPFDLGVVWINAAGKVVDACRVKKWIGIKSPKQPAKYILEIDPARLGEFQIGDEIKLEKP